VTLAGPVVLVDTHCHLDFEAYDGDREDVLAQARQTGVERILNPGIDLSTSRKAVELAENYNPVYAAVGVHPNDANTFTSSTLEELREIAAPGGKMYHKVAAWGEIGLDYYRDRASRPLQQRVFREQLAAAAELGLPVVIHNRDASADLLPILKEWVAGLVQEGSPLAERPGVLHSFAGDLETAQAAIRLNFYIGITGPVTFKNARDLQDVVAALPVSRLLIETDGPFLTPHPHRGQRNQPSFVRYTAEKIASIHNLSLRFVAEKTSDNARKLFNW
jgi:TatD DNase family protein